MKTIATPKDQSRKLTERDCQQIGNPSARIISMLPAGSHWVRIHESLEVQCQLSSRRYYLSVDLKFRTIDALRNFGWLGLTKSEATKDATELAERISKAVLAVEAANSPDAEDMAGIEYTRLLNARRLESLLARYSATIE